MTLHSLPGAGHGLHGHPRRHIDRESGLGDGQVVFLPGYHGHLTIGIGAQNQAETWTLITLVSLAAER